MTYDEIKELIDKYGEPAVNEYLQFLQPELYDRLKPKSVSEVILIEGKSRMGTSYTCEQILKLIESIKNEHAKRIVIDSYDLFKNNNKQGDKK